MENPFEILLKKIDRIENLIQELSVITVREVTQPAIERKWMNVQQVAAYLSISTSYIYKRTSTMEIPLYKRGIILFFLKEDIDNWLVGFRQKTRHEIETEAANYVMKRRRSR